MSRCPVCEEREAHPADQVPARPEGTTGALLLRVWRDGDDLRGRLLGFADPQSSARPIAAVSGVDAITDAVRDWLRTW